MKIAQINNNYFREKNHAKKDESFKGGFVLDGATKFLQTCDKYPMVGVAFTDSVATDVPRTIFDLIKTGVPAALETARREFSGLIVNCLMPSFIVLGVAKAINRPILGQKFKNIDLSSSWSNGESIKKCVDTFKESMDLSSTKTTREEIKTYFTKLLTGLNGRDGDKWVEFSSTLGAEKLNNITDTLTNTVFDQSLNKKTLKNTLSQVSETITNSTRAGEILSYDIKSGKTISSNLSELLRDSVDMAVKFKDSTVRRNLDVFKKQATKLVNTKSIAGLAIILPLAMSVQSINRAITRHMYKQKGAPIYKDFEKGDTYKEMTPAENAKFFSQKLLAAGSMVSLALLSMMKRPSMSMFQFKGMFPTVDQCRWIATATFASRMFASEDPNELRESTVRDMASFAGLYFLGDYAGKATASLIEKIRPDVKLTNRLGKSTKDSSIIKRMGDWIKNTTLKSFDEVLPQHKNLRSICELASIGFSIIFLGFLLPAYNRKVTEKKVALAKEKELRAQRATNAANAQLIINLKKDNALSSKGVFGKVVQNRFE